jgi:hypothetical protein
MEDIIKIIGASILFATTVLILSPTSNNIVKGSEIVLNMVGRSRQFFIAK